jgi:lipoprotein NlpD
MILLPQAKSLCLIVMIVLGGCATHVPAPVSDLSRTVKTADVTRIVRSGDTLYSVAWSAGVDYRNLAYWNSLKSPYVIRIGQLLVLSGNPRPKTSDQPNIVVSGIGTNTDVIQKQAIQSPSIPASKSTSTKAPIITKSSQPKSSVIKTIGSKQTWHWPVKGTLLTKYSSNSGNNGIDIGVSSGTSVKAAKGGVVVYAGAGLRGYGQLVIVKHSSEYLSAYGHNRRLLVEEGDTIVARQTIAESGMAAGGVEQLHFEIRKNGKPINPLKFL